MHPSKTVIFSMVVLGISLINAEKTVAIVPNVSIVPVVPITALDIGGQPVRHFKQSDPEGLETARTASDMKQSIDSGAIKSLKRLPTCVPPVRVSGNSTRED
jgi:hypothetical protein